MSSFVISKVNLANNKVKLDDFRERLFNLPSELSLSSIKPLKNNNSILIEIVEPVSLKFSYLDNPLDVSIRTKSIICFDTGLMVSSPTGVGVITKGGARKYIDTYIGKIIAKSFFNDESVYSPFSFTNKQMRLVNWGEELRYLKVSLPEVGNGTIAGKDLISKIKDIDNLFGSIGQGETTALKVFSSTLKRAVSISSNGTIKIQNKDILPVFEYIKKALK
nr:MAG: hypothetical protein OI716_00740 [Candidatus Methanoperedens sp.]WAI00075.1 MAG: hypothetical protein OI720_00585 [Candidatus Methanoperedens sp.]